MAEPQGRGALGTRWPNAGRLAEWIVLAAILAVAAWLHLADLDRFIASDELRWTCRSINFHGAIAERDWPSTFQVGHPGVLTMWLGAMALPLDAAGEWRNLCAETDGGSDLSALDNVGMEGVLQTIAPRLFRARLGVAWGTLAALLAIYLLVRAAAGVPAVPALGALALLALDPFLVAHSRVLHLDAVTALVAVASVVALAARDRLGRPSLVLAGALAGLAIVNKSSALVLGPFAIVFVAWRARRERAWRSALLELGLWVASAAGAAVLVWPAMWVDPLGTIRGVLTKAAEEGGTPHDSGNFFLGRPVDDPGPLFYPVAALFRLTPWALAGFAAAIYWVAGAARTRAGPRGDGHDADASAAARTVRLIGWLVVWAVLFKLFLTIGPKKFDRYLLPSLVAVDLAGGMALGLAALAAARRIGAPRARFGRLGIAYAPLAAVALVALLQAAMALANHPYELAFYNPLLGGARVARRVLLVGWGEGYDLAADWLNAQPDASGLEACARGVANFAPLFAGRTRSAPGYRPSSTDYVVLYLNQVQRRRNESLVAAYFDRPDLRPAYVGMVAGIEYVWVYANATEAPLREALAANTGPLDVLIAPGESVFARHYEGTQRLIRFWGHWGPAEMTEALQAQLPADWRRAWVIRDPSRDPDVAEVALESLAERGDALAVADGELELTPFVRRER